MVADEVCKEIGELIKGIQTQTRRAVGVTEEGAAKVQGAWARLSGRSSS